MAKKIITREDLSRLEDANNCNIDLRGRVRTARRSDADAGISLRKRRQWHIDLVPVVTAVLATATAKTSEKRNMAAGVTGTQGQAVYEDSALNLNLAKADVEATASLSGVLLNAASPGQPVKMITEGNYNPGVAVVPGTLYAVSAAAAGGIAPSTDLGSGEFPRAIGFATTTSNIYVDINNNGGEIP